VQNSGTVSKLSTLCLLPFILTFSQREKGEERLEIMRPLPLEEDTLVTMAGEGKRSFQAASQVNNARVFLMRQDVRFTIDTSALRAARA
jgi:hypothetical protein